jgi:hypothetical protein
MNKQIKSVKLNDIFYPSKTYDLLRVGKSNDGGYLVETNSFNESEFVLGLGINEDWSFETEFGKPFLGIDNQISFKFLFKKLLYELIFNILKFYELTRLKSTIIYFKKLISYKKFRKNFINGWIYGPYDSNVNFKLKDLLNLVESNNVFLKVDIEGSEYRMLDDILEIENKFTGMVIEFHDFDVHHQLVKNFIQKTQMKLCHVHSNNFCEIYNGLPTLIEFTFSKNPKILNDSKPKLPHNLDQPNNPIADEIIIN